MIACLILKFNATKNDGRNDLLCIWIIQRQHEMIKSVFTPKLTIQFYYDNIIILQHTNYYMCF